MGVKVEVNKYNVEFSTPIMHRHIPALASILPVRKKLTHKVLSLIAPLGKHTLLSILAKHYIFLF
jgi:hypothetical protein